MSKNKLKYTLDKRDIKILNTICDNARLPYSKIGRMTKVSKDSVRKRMKNLQKELFILSYNTLINYSKLSYKLFYVYIRSKKPLSLKSRLIKSLISDKKFLSILHLIGKYDIELQIVAKSISAVKKILKKSVKEKNMIVLTSFLPYIYSMRIGDTQTEIISQADNKRKFTLDKLDLDILRILSVNARERLTEITRRTGSAEDVIRYRIRALLKNKVILGFYTRTNKHRMGLFTYTLLLNLDGSIDRSELLSIKEIVNIFYVRRFKGKYSLGINFYAKDNKDLLKVIDSIRKIFKNKLVNFDLLTVLERHKFTPFP
ncbi:MAG: AsnC family transcriptional regulator [archaeon]|nr:AsnC family transcriptional regulator [archaeon]